MNDAVRKNIQSAIVALQKALSALGTQEPSAPTAQTRTVCPVCNGEMKPDATIRGVHPKCYQRLQREDRLDEAELLGVLLPKDSPGRKKLINLDNVLQKNSDKHSRKPKQKP